MHHYYRTAAWAITALWIAAATLYTVLVCSGHQGQASSVAGALAWGGAFGIIVIGFVCLFMEDEE